MPANQPGAVPPDEHGNRSKGRLPFLFGATPGNLRKFFRTKRRQRLTAALCVLNGLVGFTTDDDDTRHGPPAHNADKAHDIRDSHDNTDGDSGRIRTRTPVARPPRVRAHKQRVVPRKLPAVVERTPAPAERSPMPGVLAKEFQS
jgi:hypothetical protein